MVAACNPHGALALELLHGKKNGVTKVGRELRA